MPDVEPATEPDNSWDAARSGAPSPAPPPPAPGVAAPWVPPSEAALPAAHATVAEEIAALLPTSSGQVGAVARLMAEGVTDRKELVARGAAANTGAVANMQSNIRAIRDGDIPEAPSLARLARGAAGSFLRQHRAELSDAAVAHLGQVVATADAVASSHGAQTAEQSALEKKGDVLEETLAQEGGVYVFTFPHYWWYPTVEGTERTLLKVGMTTKDAGVRVKAQARQSGVPEDPLLLRVYQSDTYEPAALEKVFHRLVKAADHVRDSTSGGTEWFETSVEFLDTIAEVLGARTILTEEPE